MLTIDDLERADVEGRSAAVKAAVGLHDPRRLTAAWRLGQGTALRWLRERAGLSQDDVARIVGAGERGGAVVYSWEKGKYYAPIRAMQLLADHYGLPFGRFSVVGLPTVGETRDPVAAHDPWAVGRE